MLDHVDGVNVSSRSRDMVGSLGRSGLRSSPWFSFPLLTAVLLAGWTSSLQVQGHALVTCCSRERCPDSGPQSSLHKNTPISVPSTPSYERLQGGAWASTLFRKHIRSSGLGPCHRGCLSLSHKEPAPQPHPRMENGLLNEGCLLTIGVNLLLLYCSTASMSNSHAMRRLAVRRPLV